MDEKQKQTFTNVRKYKIQRNNKEIQMQRNFKDVITNKWIRLQSF